MGDRFMTLRRVGAWALDLSSFEVSLFLQQHIFLIEKKKHNNMDNSENQESNREQSPEKFEDIVDRRIKKNALNE